MRALLVITFAILVVFPSSTHAEASCELTPLTLPLFDATPLAIFVAPISTPADAVLSPENAKDVLEQFVACTNTGDPTLIWAIFTPHWFAREFADSETHYLPAFEYEIARGNEIVVDPLELVSVDEIAALEDGRVAVTATFTSANLTWTDQLILANIDGVWLIDEVVLITPAN